MSSPTATATAPKPPFDWNAVVRSPAFIPGVAALAGLLICFASLVGKLYHLWSQDEYYSHGFIVPLMVGYVIYKWWPKLKELPVKPSWFALIPLAGVLYLTRAATVTDIEPILGGCFILAILAGVWFVLGLRWALSVLFPAGFFVFMLPVWGAVIDNYTNPLQLLSTKVAFKLLELTGFQPWQDDPTIIQLNRFTLDVGVPCSGFKLMLAVTAFTIFFMMIGGLKFWGNVIMASCVIPLCLFINGMRIAFIGMVGDTWGKDAGHTFHDWSGYISLIICFLILFKIARLLGWKD